MIIFPVLLMRERKRRQKEQLAEQKRQFCDALMTMSGLLLTGMPLEKVYSKTASSLVHIYGPGNFMSEEFERMDAGIRMNRSAEEVLFEFAERSIFPEARQLAHLVTYVRRSNGKVEEVCGNLAYQMGKAFETESEIRKILSSGRTELGLMRILPPAILLMLRLSDPDLLRPLYASFPGEVFSALCFLVYCILWIVTDRMMEC